MVTFPRSVGTSTSAPSAASQGARGSSMWRSSSRRSNVGWGATRTCRYRSPRGPSPVPAPPSPAAHAGAIADAGGDLDLDPMRLHHLAGAPAGGTDRLVVPAGAAARRTALLALKLDRAARPLGRLLERDLDRRQQVLPRHPADAAPA